MLNDGLCLSNICSWSRNFVIPSLQSLGDVFELAMRGEDVEGLLRARGEYRPHSVSVVHKYRSFLRSNPRIAAIRLR